MANGSLYTISAEIRDNMSAGLNNINAELRNSQKAAKEAKTQIQNFQNQISSVTGNLSGFASALRSGDISGFATNILNAGTAVKSLGPLLTGLKTNLAGIVAEVTAATGGINLLVAGFAAIGVGAIQSGTSMQKSQQDLQALLGVSDDVVDEYTQAAVDMSKNTKQSASDVLDAFTLIGSQAPQLLDDKEGLEGVTQAAQTLSKAAGMDLTDAASAITTAMNQMGISAKDATSIIDGLATGAQKGSADIEYQKTAIEKSGSAAKMAGLSYQDLIASIETIAPSFSSADVAGNSLKSTLLALETQQEQKFKPSVVGINQALQNLSDANLTAEEKVQLFGRGNITCAEALLSNKQSLQEMQQALSETGSATEMANAKSGSFSQVMSSLARIFRDFFAELSQMTIIKDLITIITALGVAIGVVLKVFLQIINIIMQVANFVWVLIKAFIALLGQAIQPLINGIISLGRWINSIGFGHIYDSAVKWLNKVLSLFRSVVKSMEQAWDRFTGKTSKDAKKVPQGKVKPKKVDEDSDANKPDANKPTRNSHTSKTNQPTFVSGSLSDLENKLQTLQKKYKDGLIKLSPDEYKREIQVLGKQIKDKKIALGIDLYVSSNSLQTVSEEIQKEANKLQILDPDKDIHEIEQIGKKIDELKKKENKIKLTLALTRGANAVLDPNTSLDIVQEAKKNLQDALNNVPFETKPSLVDQIKKELEQLDATEYFLKIKINPDLEVPKNSVQGISDEIQKKTKKLNLLDTTKDIDQINKLKSEIEALKDKQAKANSVTGNGLYVQSGSQRDLSNQISKKKAELEVQVVDSPEYKQLIKEIQDLTLKKKKIDIQVEADSLTPAEKKLKKINKASDDTSKTFGAMGSIFQSVGQMSDDETATIMNGLGSIAGSIAEAVPAILSLIGVKTGEALATGSSEAMKLGFPACIPAIATVTAAVMSVASTITSVIGSFAEGGIISGGSQIGDNMIAKVNAGEMILNGKQQQNLFKMINQGNLQPNQGSVVSSSNIKVRGSDLYLTLKNFSKTKSKSGLNTGIL